MRRVCLLVLLATCGTKHGPAPTRRPISDQALVLPTDVPQGLDIHLSAAKAGPPPFDRGKLAPATALAPAEIEQLLKRAPALPAAATASVAIRPASTPPPRTGAVVPMAANAAPPPSVRDPQLHVLRYQPEGKVPIAPELAITFSQPMVAITSQDDAAKSVPVTLTPTPAGQWRWIGTRTLLFDPEVRFPQATTYRVDIAKGTPSAVGGALGEATSFTFETPAPTLVSSAPAGISKLDPAMFALFDQKIDPAAVLAKVTVRANGVVVPVELVTKPDKQLQAIIDAADKNEQQGRYLAFHPTKPFPRDATIDVELGAGTPSAEGPNKTGAAQRFAFKTFPPLAVAHAECGWNHECRPNMPFRIETTTPLDEERWKDADVTVSPEIGDLRITASGSSLNLSGSTAAHTTYKVTLAGAIRDTFGQTLERDVTLTFTVGDAEPAFWGPDRMVVLDPAARARTLDFFTTTYAKLGVQLYKVTPADLDAYLGYQRNRWNHDHPPAMPGTKVFDGAVDTAKGELAETHLALKAALDGNGTGMAVAVVTPLPWKETYEAPKLVTWIQATSLAIDAHLDGDQLVAYVSDLATGKPIADADVDLRGTHARTDAKGLATLALGPPAKGAHYLVAKKGGDVAMLVDESSWWNDQGSWTKQARPTQLAWYATPDRFLYKPGEEVHFKGWVRRLDLGKGGDVELVDVGPIRYRALDSNRVELAKGTITPNAAGGFDGVISLPKTPNLGYAWIELGAANGTHSLGFQIEEFRRPEFEVGAKASQGPFLVGGSAEVTATAKYYSGGPLPGAPVSWYVNASPTSFTPPNRDAYIFGQWRPWWGWDGDRGPNANKSFSFSDKTDATGAQTLHLDFLSAKPALPMAVTASASITDVNRQQWSASAPLLVHPASVYVGLKPQKPFVDKGTPYPVEVIAVDLDGKQVVAKLDVRAARLDYKYAHGQYKEIELDPQACDPAKCEFATPKGGEYRITATVVDDKGRANQTIMTFWVSGGERAPSREAELEKVTLIPDRKSYAPGDTAEVLVQSPFSPAEAIVTWRRGGIVKLERLHLDGPTTKLSVPIADAMTPGIYVAVDLVGAAPRATDTGDPDPKLPKRPAFAAGQLYLEVPPAHRTLAVTVTPAAAKVGPGEKTKIAVEVKDAAGHPVANADTAVIVVDEAILALAGAQFASPIATFYPNHGPGVRDERGRAALRLARPDATIVVTKNAIAIPPPPPPAPPGEARSETTPSPKKRPMDARLTNGLKGDSDADGILDEKDLAPDSPIAVRANFNPLAAFAPQVKTDAQGRATVEVAMPDNLTRYRVVAIAAAGKQFGKGESTLTARLPLMVRPSPPRFLNFGDAFALPIVVQNQTDAPMTVKVAARASNAQLRDAGRTVTVPANDRVELELAAMAELPGTARFQVVASAGAANDAAEVALPVWTPATTEAFATYGTIESDAIAQPVALPGANVPGYGGLEVTAASTQLQSLTDAVIYLARYPFECAEQRSSRIAAIASLRDVLEAFHAKELPSKAELEASVKTDVEHLSQMQNSDGGFAYWDRGYPSEPFLSVYVAGALGRAKAKGFTVDGRVLGSAIQYLRKIPFPAFYSQEVRWAIRAYAFDVRRQLGDADVAGAKALYKEAFAGKPSLETAGWLLAALAGEASAVDERKALVRLILNRASETAGAASFAASYGDGSYLILASDRRVDAVLLDALLAEQPKNDLIPKLVTGLLAHRTAGRWLSTNENAFALTALDSYFHAYEAVTPDFVARVWLGSDGVGEHRFKGRTTESAQLDVAMADVAKHDKQRLTIAKEGPGRLYYRIGMTYAPASLALAPADRGFVVQRRYEAIDDAKDVVRAADGTWKIKAGARVRVRVTMVNEARRYHVALVDPLPAGFEAMNPALATTGPIPTDPKAARPGWWGPWYEHQNLRDERVEAFAALLWEGTHEYEYVARATTTGTFVVPPPKAEEMYMPETFGRGGTDRVVIE